MIYRDDFVKKASKNGGMHGDVGIVRVDAVPEGAKAIKTRIIAEGEATGHHHVLEGDAQVYEVQTETGVELYVELFGPDVKVKHQEHGTIELEPGTYWICRQVEYDGEEERRVMD